MVPGHAREPHGHISSYSSLEPHEVKQAAWESKLLKGTIPPDTRSRQLCASNPTHAYRSQTPEPPQTPGTVFSFSVIGSLEAVAATISAAFADGDDDLTNLERFIGLVVMHTAAVAKVWGGTRDGFIHR